MSRPELWVSPSRSRIDPSEEAPRPREVCRTVWAFFCLGLCIASAFGILAGSYQLGLRLVREHVTGISEEFPLVVFIVAPISAGLTCGWFMAVVGILFQIFRGAAPTSQNTALGS